MSKINEDVAKAITAAVEATGPEELAEATGKLMQVFDEKVRTATEENVRLHAINLAVALHKDTFRFRFGKSEEPEPDPTDEVLASARRFAEFIAATE